MDGMGLDRWVERGIEHLVVGDKNIHIFRSVCFTSLLLQKLVLMTLCLMSFLGTVFFRIWTMGVLGTQTMSSLPGHWKEPDLFHWRKAHFVQWRETSASQFLGGMQSNLGLPIYHVCDNMALLFLVGAILSERQGSP